jgi:uncharacterized protein (DUF433 family)
MALTCEPLPVPWREDKNGVIRVGETRVRLETVLWHYRNGESPATIVDAFPPLKLSDVHRVIAYYLEHPAEINEYLVESERREEEMRAFIESQPGYEENRQRLRAFRDQREGNDASSAD